MNFTQSCKTENIQVIDAILRSKHHEALFSREIDAEFQLCALNDQSIVIQMFLESSFFIKRRPSSGEKTFVVTIDSGFVNVMKLFIFY